MGKNKNFDDISIYDASDFWDEHDFGEFHDVKEVSEIKFSLKKKRYVGINKDLYAQITSKAKMLRKPEEALINEWLSEKADVIVEPGVVLHLPQGLFPRIARPHNEHAFFLFRDSVTMGSSASLCIRPTQIKTNPHARTARQNKGQNHIQGEDTAGKTLEADG